MRRFLSSAERLYNDRQDVEFLNRYKSLDVSCLWIRREVTSVLNCFYFKRHFIELGIFRLLRFPG